ncbi:ComEA family DNA-binding protein [Nocardioides pantholopis]|uniref:ComEA family DNA-binding protein n=1 Tax=Nocardioides pantholopis TaxID=2483798 RepID=UPI000F08E78B|nr:ComEA family DNA-binding protein [Nocardioides pantholopis]
MRSRPSPDHQAAVSRRLAQLGAELAASRIPAPGPEGPHAPSGPEDDDAWWAGHTRVATVAPAGRLTPPGPAEPEPEPDLLAPAPRASVVPVPGRHAARRGGRAPVAAGTTAVAGLVPEPLRGRAGLGPGPVAVVAVLVALGLAATCWWVVRADPGEPVGRLASADRGALATPAGPGSPGVAPGAEAASPGAEEGASGTGTVTVDVAGKVRRPGIAVLPAGSRVVDALEAAGGARPGVDLTGLNLARLLVDGEQVLVGRAAAAVAGPSSGPPGGTAPGTAGAPGAALVNLNLASQAELELLPDVGPVTAQAIIAWREEHGGFGAVEELLEVDGIGDVTLAKLTPHVTV